MKKYISLIVLTVVVGALPLFVQYGGYLLNVDYFGQEIPFIMETRRMFLSGAPWWSWNTYFGDNFIAGYGFYTLASPFVWLNCLVPAEWMVHSLFLTLILKYVCAFLAARLWLRKVGVSPDAACVGGLLYAFSSYAVSNSYYYHFFEPLIAFPLFLWAVERFLCKDRYGNVTLALAAFLVVFVNYYFASCSFLAALMYVFCRVCFSGRFREFVSRVPLGVLLIVLGVALDAFLLLPTYIHLSASPRAHQGIMTGMDFTAWPTFVERLRTLLMPQVLEDHTKMLRSAGWNSCSVTLPAVGVLLAALYCWRNKFSWITALTAISVIAFLTPLNSAFSLFTNPNYTRWAYALSLFLVLPTVKWIEGLPSAPLRAPWRSFAVYAVLCFAVFAFAVACGHGVESLAVKVQLVAYVAVLAVSLLCLAAYFASGCRRRALAYCVAVAACAQMCVFHLLHSDAYFRYVNDKELRQDAVKPYMVDNEFPRRPEDASMRYRTAFEARYLNLAMLKNTPSVTTFHSILNPNLYKLVTATDTIESSFHNSVVPSYYSRSFYALMSVKEVVKYKDPHMSGEKHLNLRDKTDTEGYTVCDNLDYIPMGFTYDTFVTEDLIDTLRTVKPQPDIPLVMLSNLVVPQADKAFCSQYLKEGAIDLSADMDSVVAVRRQCTASYFDGVTSGFVSRITLPRDNLVFYSVPADKGFTACVDGKQTEIHSVNLGLSAVFVPKGTHEVVFSFFPVGLKEGTEVSGAALLLLLLVGWRERRKTLKVKRQTR